MELKRFFTHENKWDTLLFCSAFSDRCKEKRSVIRTLRIWDWETQKCHSDPEIHLDWNDLQFGTNLGLMPFLCTLVWSQLPLTRRSFSNNKSFEFPKDHSIWLHLMTQLAATFLKRSSFSFMSDIVLCQIQFECKWHCYVYKCCIIYLTTNAFLFNLIDGSGGEQAF